MINHAAFRFATRFTLASALAVMGTGLVGCGHDDKPHDYGQERPAINDLDSRDKGLQSRDINQSADQMAADLLADPALNRSKEQWTMVVGKMDDLTRNSQFGVDYDIFLQALKARIAKQGKGRVQLITNREKFYKMRSDEREGGGKDEFGQGGGGQPGAPAAINPDFILNGVVRSLKNQGTVYYQFEFNASDMVRRTEAWTGSYTVKVAR